jgi:hypothetical protein
MQNRKQLRQFVKAASTKKTTDWSQVIGGVLKQVRGDLRYICIHTPKLRHLKNAIPSSNTVGPIEYGAFRSDFDCERTQYHRNREYYQEHAGNNSVEYPFHQVFVAHKSRSIGESHSERICLVSRSGKSES